MTFCGFRAKSHKAKCFLQKFVWCKRHLSAAGESLLFARGMRVCVICRAHLDAVQASLSSAPRSRLAWMTLGGLQCTWLFLPFYFLNQNDIEDRGSVAVQGRECPLLSPCSPAPSLLPPRALKRRLCLAASPFISFPCCTVMATPPKFNIIQA